MHGGDDDVWTYPYWNFLLDNGNNGVVSPDGDGGMARARYGLEGVLCHDMLVDLRWQEYASLRTNLV